MDEKKFSICNLAMDAIILKIAALTNGWVRDILTQIKMNDEDLSESRIALSLDDLYEYAILMEPNDKDIEPFKKVIEAFMMELPNVEKYKQLYNWSI